MTPAQHKTAARLAAQHPDPCEWNAADDRYALKYELHDDAALIVGESRLRDGWRLCADCAALARFAQMNRRPIWRAKDRVA